jgi:hypothetical protein
MCRTPTCSPSSASCTDRALPGRKAFPSETKERGNLSEWLGCSQGDLLRRAFRDLAKDPKLNPIGAFRVSKNKIYRMKALDGAGQGRAVSHTERAHHHILVAANRRTATT